MSDDEALIAPAADSQQGNVGYGSVADVVPQQRFVCKVPRWDLFQAIRSSGLAIALDQINHRLVHRKKAEPAGNRAARWFTAGVYQRQRWPGQRTG
jgi:hypothetical protein